MKKYLIIFIAFSLAFSFLQAKGHKGKNRHHQLMGLVSDFENLDTNQDKKLSKKEAAEPTIKKFDAINKNSDDHLNQDEFVDYEINVMEQIAKLKLKTLTEKKRNNLEDRIINTFNRLDENNDGKVTQDEMLAKTNKLLDKAFNRLDKNEDGLLDEDEMKKLKKRHKKGKEHHHSHDYH